MRAVNEKFADLGLPRRVWAVAAIGGEKERLATLHDHLASRMAPRDRLVYLGNYMGPSTARSNAAVMEELLSFRSALLAMPGMKTTDIVHLRGPAEEAWQRLLRLQFAPVPSQTLESLLDAGVEGYLRLYGISLNDTRSITRAGSVAMTRWTNQLRFIQRQAPGHEPFTSSMRRAAISHLAEGTESMAGARKMLFVPAGYDSSRRLEDQGDMLWFGQTPFETSGRNSSTYARIVRGFDAERGGVSTESSLVTLDGGCGKGGPLVCGCFNASAQLEELITVGGKGALDAQPIGGRPATFATPKLRNIAEPYWTDQIATGV